MIENRSLPRNLHRLFTLVLGAAAITALVGGCDKNASDSVSTYRVPKESAPPAMASATGAATAADAQQTPAGPEIEWTVPQGWRQRPAGEMRYASFIVAEGESPLELTVVPLGSGVPLLANINRWEGQLDLPPSKEADLGKVMTKRQINGVPVTVVDLKNKKQRLLVAMFERPERTWFFKMFGPEDLVTAQQVNFDAFTSSVRFTGRGGPAAMAATEAAGEGGGTQLPPGHPPAGGGGGANLPPGHPPAGGGNMGQMPGSGAGGGPASGLAKYVAPEGWQQEPPRPFREVSFFTGSGDDKAEVIVSRLPVDNGGTLAANINRWRGQLGLEPITDVGVYQPKDVNVGSAKGALLDIGAVEKNKPAKTLVVVMAVNGPDMWYFKISGPAKTVADQQANFEKFLSSVQFAGGQ